MKNVLTVLLLVLGQPLVAQPTAMTWQGHLEFDPSQAAPGGGTVGNLMIELFGDPALTGTVPISGRFGFDTAMPFAARNERFAAAPNAVVEMSVEIGFLTLSADLPRIAQQSHLSRVGSQAFAGGPFCTTFEICDFLGLPRASWGNQAYVILQSNYVELVDDDTRLEQEYGATLGVMVGLTPQFGDFQPVIATQFGAVAIDGMAISFDSFPGRPVFRELALPHLRILEGTQDIEFANVYIDFEIEGFAETIELSGKITAAQIDS